MLQFEERPGLLDIEDAVLLIEVVGCDVAQVGFMKGAVPGLNDSFSFKLNQLFSSQVLTRWTWRWIP